MSNGSIADRKAWSLALITLLALVVAGADLLSKGAVERWIGPDGDHQEWWLVDGQIGFAFGRNSGAAFGLFRGNPEMLAVISVFVAVAFCLLIASEVKRAFARIVSAGLLLGGALGNLFERVRYGYVTDFIALGPWPRFNVADSAISIGVAIFIIAIVFQTDPRRG